MGPIDAFWHLLNFFAPAISVGLLTPLLAKIIWRRELKGTAWRSLSLWSTGLSAMAWMIGLVAFGRDGRMASYGIMLAACAAALWWVGFGARSRS